MRQRLFNRQFHSSWAITALAVGILIGTASVPFIEHYDVYTPIPTFIAASALIVAGLWKRTMLALVIIGTGGLLLGLWSGSSTLLSLQAIKQYHGENIQITGTVRDDTTRGPSGDQRLQLDTLSVENVSLAGTIWVSTTDQVTIKRSDRITIKGTVSEGFGTMQASVFRAQLINIIRPEPGDIARVIRDRFSQQVQQLVAEPQATLGVSFLVGQRSALSDDIQQLFRDLGLIHLVVASGFHLTIVVRFSRRLFADRSKYLALLSSLLLIGSFLLLTGFSTSMTRASLVTGLSLLAWYVGRSIHPVVLLLLVAAATVLINPVFIWGDLAWYLSFSAFGGVIILAPLIHAYFWPSDKEPGYIRHLLVATLAAQITTFPIIAFTFEQYSPLALLANLVVLPAVPPIMLLTFLTGLISFLIPPIASLLSIPLELLLRYVTFIADYLISLPWAVGSISMSPPMLAGSYAVILGFIGYLRYASKHRLRNDNPIV